MRIKTSVNEVLQNLTNYVEDAFLDLIDLKETLNNINTQVLTRIRQMPMQNINMMTSQEKEEYLWLISIHKIIDEIMRESE